MGQDLTLRPPSALAPERTLPTVVPPRLDPGGLIDATLARWEATRHARTLDALAKRTRAEAGLFDAQTQALESYVQRQRAAQRLQDLPEVLASERARARIERADLLRQAQHRYELAELARLCELAEAETALLDARQQLDAQRTEGGSTYRLAWTKRRCELLDLELSIAERRALLNEHRGGRSGSTLDAALSAARDELRASGLDTAALDAVIHEREARDEPAD